MPPTVRLLAALVTSAAASQTDFRSVAGLCAASAVGASPSTVRSWCRREHIEAHGLLDLARVLRALTLAARHNCHATELLDVDPRTLASMLKRGGIGAIDGSMTIEQFCGSQQYVPNKLLLARIKDVCAVRGS